MSTLLSVDNWLSLLALATIEIILGVDNLVFIAIVTSKLPLHQQKVSTSCWFKFSNVLSFTFISFYCLVSPSY